MNLYLLRHGIAVERGTRGFTNDRERPLTAEGIGKVRAIAGAMREMGLAFDLILSSPLVRARQTAEIVAKRLEGAEVRLTEALAPGGNSRQVLDHLRGLAGEEILLVGHEPNLSGFISFLVAGRTGFSVRMKKGGLGLVSCARLAGQPRACLEWLLTPRQMALMK